MHVIERKYKIPFGGNRHTTEETFGVEWNLYSSFKIQLDKKREKQHPHSMLHWLLCSNFRRRGDVLLGLHITTATLSCMCVLTCDLTFI